MLTIGSVAPDFVAESTEGEIKFYDWMGTNWCVFFSHPKDFTPVCTTELGVVAGLMDEFAARDCKVIGISVDPVESHMKWKADIAAVMGEPVSYPLIGDPQLKIAKLFGMLPHDAGDTAFGRSAADNATVRSVFIIGPDRKVKLALTYPMTTGRNFAEIIRVLDSLQLTADRKVATPANWQQGEDVIIVPSVSDSEARTLFPDGWNAPRPYMRVVPQPT